MVGSDFQEYGLELPQRILVVNGGSLLDEGVVRLISERPNFEVFTVNFEGEDVLVNDIVTKCPEVVVMGQPSSIKLEKLYGVLTSFPALEKLRLIIFHSNDNSVDVFSQGHLMFIRGDDFIELVQNA